MKAVYIIGYGIYAIGVAMVMLENILLPGILVELSGMTVVLGLIPFLERK